MPELTYTQDSRPAHLGNYQIFAELKRSESGATYRGFDPATGKLAILKTFIKQDSGSPHLAALRRFEKEAAVYSRINHANIIRLLGFGVERGIPYLALEFVDGLNLRSLLELAPEKKLPPLIAVTLVAGILSGLEALHKQGIVHRDLKPENLLLRSDGCVKICDFDLASFAEQQNSTQETGLTGSVGYVSPEVVLGHKATPAADIFALGVLFYELLSGARPFTSPTASGYMNAIVRTPHFGITKLVPGVPKKLEAILDNMLAKKPEERFQSATAALQAIHAAFEIGNERKCKDRLRAYIGDPAVRVAPLADLERKAGHEARPLQNLWAAALMGIAAIALLLMFVLKPAPPSPDRQSAAKTQLAPDSLAGLSAAAVSLPRESGQRAAQPPANPPAESPRALKETTVAPQQQPPSKDQAAPARRIVIQSHPWAYVFMAGDSLGSTPLQTPLPLKYGTHHMLLKNPQFPPLEIHFEVTAASSETLSVMLWDLIAQLEVKVVPWGDFYLNGKQIDLRSFNHALYLLPGQYELRFVHPTLGEKSQTILLRAGETRRITANLF